MNATGIEALHAREFSVSQWPPLSLPRGGLGLAPKSSAWLFFTPPSKRKNNCILKDKEFEVKNTSNSNNACHWLLWELL
jgi:hypothetical protein